VSWPIRVLLIVVCALHFVLGASLGLSVDEAHYALYATHLALSYFDHPPLVGWVQWPLVALDAPTAVLRLVPELLWLGTALLVHRVAQRLQGSTAAPRGSLAAGRLQAGDWAVLALCLSPLLHVLGIGLLPDTLLMFFTALLMLQTLRLMDATTAQQPLPWLALGVVLGLAGLSKYTAILPAVAVAACLLRAHGLRLLANRWLWLAVLVALMLVSPVAVWNQQNGWISLAYQAQHGAGGGWQAVHELRFLLVQVLAFGPLLCWGLWGVWRTGRFANTPHAVWGGLFFAVPFAVLAVLAGGGTSLPHWTAPAWVVLAPFAGVALVQVQRRWAVRGVVALQVLACGALLGLMASGGVPLVASPEGRGNSAQPSNPFADLHGWEQAGAQARSLAAQHGLSSVSVQNWTLASRLGWYARHLPVQVLDNRVDQFDLWAAELPAGANTLLVDWSQLAYQLPVGAQGFARCEPLGTHAVQRLGATLAHFRFYACYGWAGVPKAQLQPQLAPPSSLTAPPSESTTP
jgi:hypothetical protein